jgi:hypothetical protein
MKTHRLAVAVFMLSQLEIFDYYRVECVLPYPKTNETNVTKP